MELKLMLKSRLSIISISAYLNKSKSTDIQYFAPNCVVMQDVMFLRQRLIRQKKILPEILPDLQEDAQKLLKQNGFQIDEPSDCDEEEHVTKIRCAPREWIYPDDETEDQDEDEEDEESESEITEFDMPPKNHCIFLMKNGLCALHKYYLDTGQNWVTQKFNICTTFPIDARVEDKTLAFMKEFDDFAFAEIECLSGDMEMKEDLDYPQLIDSMKDVIIDRFGKEWWNSLNNFAKDYRAGLIDLDYIYSDVDL